MAYPPADGTVPVRAAWIDLDALRTNVERAGSGAVDVSGDGYGHGAERTARAALDGGAESLVVRDEREARLLRSTGIEAEIRLATMSDDPVTTAVYGVGPDALPAGLRPAMRVGARVVSVKTIDAGEPVSYGYTWRASVRSTLAIVPLGYADGVARSASNRGFLRLDGMLRPIVGRVAMDVVVLDLGTDTVALGAEAVLFGGGPGDSSAEEWGRWAGMTALEVTSSIGSRVTRIASTRGTSAQGSSEQGASSPITSGRIIS